MFRNPRTGKDKEKQHKQIHNFFTYHNDSDSNRFFRLLPTSLSVYVIFSTVCWVRIYPTLGISKNRNPSTQNSGRISRSYSTTLRYWVEYWDHTQLHPIFGLRLEIGSSQHIIRRLNTQVSSPLNVPLHFFFFACPHLMSLKASHERRQGVHGKHGVSRRRPFPCQVTQQPKRLLQHLQPQPHLKPSALDRNIKKK